MKLTIILLFALTLSAKDQEASQEAKLVRILEKNAAKTKVADAKRIQAVQALSRYCASIDKQMLMSNYGSLACMPRLEQTTQPVVSPSAQQKPLVIPPVHKDPPPATSAPDEIIHPKT